MFAFGLALSVLRLQYSTVLFPINRGHAFVARLLDVTGSPSLVTLVRIVISVRADGRALPLRSLYCWYCAGTIPT